MQTIYEAVRKQAKRVPDRVAIGWSSGALSYSELIERSDRLAEELLSSGVLAGQTIVYQNPNSPGHFVCLLACSKAGFNLLSIPPRVTESEFSRISESSAPAAILRGWPEIEVEKASSSGKTRAEDALLVLQSSGTTAAPHWIDQTERGIRSAINRAIRCLELNEKDTGLSPMSLSHAGGYYVVSLPLLSIGASVHLMERAGPEAISSALRSTKASVLHASPYMMSRLKESPYWDVTDLKNLRLIALGSSRIDPKLVRELHRRGAQSVLRCYGLTEFSPPALVARSFSVDDELGSLGTLADPSISFRIEDDGELFLKEDAGSWIATGDLVSLENGKFHFLGRKPQLIKVRGLPVYPAEIEALLLEIPGVSECVVVGNDQRSVAFVSLEREAQRDAVLNTMSAACRRELSSHKIPQEFVFVDSLPRNKMGKVDYRELSRRND